MGKIVSPFKVPRERASPASFKLPNDAQAGIENSMVLRVIVWGSTTLRLIQREVLNQVIQHVGEKLIASQFGFAAKLY